MPKARIRKRCQLGRRSGAEMQFVSVYHAFLPTANNNSNGVRRAIGIRFCVYAVPSTGPL